jgi:hypothetical protein
VQAPTRFELILNLRTAGALALDVAAKLLALAGDVIEQLSMRPSASCDAGTGAGLIQIGGRGERSLRDGRFPGALGDHILAVYSSEIGR